MVGAGKLQNLPVVDIELDRSNPRISKFLEQYDSPTPEQLFLALGAASDDDQDASTSFEKLKSSILRNGGIIQPIIVSRRPDGCYVCIEGNTRVALYKDFLESRTKGDWSTIPALVYPDMNPQQIDAIRLQLHLVGTRPWDPYSKAKYLHYLRTEEMLPFDDIVEFSGGRKKDVVDAINAFQSMERYYRPIVGDGNFDSTRFSGFVELQKPGVKEAIVEAGFTEADFARWIADGKLYPLHHVRDLSKILRTAKARKLFLEFGAKRALEALDRPGLSDALLNAKVGDLAHALSYSLLRLPFPEADQIRNDPSSDLSLALRDALASLQQLLQVARDED